MKNKKNVSENYLDRRPKRMPELRWSSDEKGLVTLEIDNTGFFNKLAQIFFKKPKISYVHLDEMGSFLWQRINGKKDIAELGEDVKAEFADAAEPLYERLAKYFQILDSYGFIAWGK